MSLRTEGAQAGVILKTRNTNTRPQGPFLVRHPLPSPQVSGGVSYNGHTLEQFLPQRTAAYVPQTDCHIGELTVRDTLDFSAAMRGPAFPPGGRKGRVDI